MPLSGFPEPAQLCPLYYFADFMAACFDYYLKLVISWEEGEGQWERKLFMPCLFECRLPFEIQIKQLWPDVAFQCTSLLPLLSKTISASVMTLFVVMLKFYTVFGFIWPGAPSYPLQGYGILVSFHPFSVFHSIFLVIGAQLSGFVSEITVQARNFSEPQVQEVAASIVTFFFASNLFFFVVCRLCAPTLDNKIPYLVIVIVT